MTDEGLFLEAIRARPGDDVPQLLFADWLEEQGDPRGEFLRLRVALSRWDMADDRRRRLEDRQRELFASLSFDGSFVPATRWTNSIGMAFVLVPKGIFWMSEHGQNAQRQVTMERDFEIGVYPVTQGQWQDVMGNNPSHFSRTGDKAAKVRDISDEELRQFPVEFVSFKDVGEFLRRLNDREKGSGWLYRLPTEAEWEYVCRGGPFSSTQERCSFDFYLAEPTNDLSSTQANFDGNHPAGQAKEGPYLERPSKVGSYPPNQLGLYDMHGNVWEWTDTLYDSDGSHRVVRGGGWDWSGSDCRAASRDWLVPSSRFDGLGVRVARVPVG
jgi:uncharacterized protein (TIGR02996 family)